MSSFFFNLLYNCERKITGKINRLGLLEPKGGLRDIVVNKQTKATTFNLKHHSDQYMTTLRYTVSPGFILYLKSFI